MKRTAKRSTKRSPAPRLSAELTAGITAALEKKPLDVIVLDLTKASAFTDFFVICTGTNVRQVQAIATAVEDALRRKGTKPALIEDRDGAVTTWTYAELNRQANRLAHVFMSLGLKPGERFISCGPNSLGVVCAGHARAKVGATVVPLNYRLTAEESAYIVEDSDAVLIYTDAEHAATLGPGG